MAKSKSLITSCPMDVTMNILSGKWKIPILWKLTKGAARFSELQKAL